MWRGYILISNLPPGWTKSERDRAWDAMRCIGKKEHPQPSHVNHSRLSLDGSALLVEAEFAESEITRAAVVATIAAALNVQPSAVEAKITYTVLADGGTWDESNQAAQAYLAANRAEWERE
jgi:hypothetical protein